MQCLEYFIVVKSISPRDSPNDSATYFVVPTNQFHRIFDVIYSEGHYQKLREIPDGTSPYRVRFRDNTSISLDKYLSKKSFANYMWGAYELKDSIISGKKCIRGKFILSQI